MTINKILREIDLRISCLRKKRVALEDARVNLRHSDPYRNMSDEELDELPQKSEFWQKYQSYTDRIYPIEKEIRILKKMKYAYEHSDI